MTFFLRSEKFKSIISELLISAGWEEKGKQLKNCTNIEKKNVRLCKPHELAFLPVDLYYVDSYWEYKTFNQDTKNSIFYNHLLNKSAMVNKLSLYVSMLKSHPRTTKKYMMPTYAVYSDDLDIINHIVQSTYILKPTYGFEGKGIKISDRPDILIEHVRKTKDRYQEWALVKYLEKPLLLEGKKFHIRSYMVISIIGGVVRGYWYPTGFVYLAKNRYDLSDISDTTKHVTTGLEIFDDEKDLIFPDFFLKHYPSSRVENINKQIIKLFKFVFDAHYKDFSKPQHCQNCFEIFGTDIMITEDFRVKLIEVNEKVGFGGPQVWRKKFIADLFDITLGKVYELPKVINNRFISIGKREIL